MIPHPQDQFASNHAPHRVPPEDCFSCDREVLFDQASRIELVNLGHSPSGKVQMFLVFGRWCHILAPEGYFQSERGMRWGVEIVAYRASNEGEVFDWDRRHEVSALSFEQATIKLRFQLANDAASLSHTGELAPLSYHGQNLNSAEAKLADA